MRSEFHMDAGEMKQTVTLQSPGGSRDAVGQRVTVWTNVATVPASVQPLTVREQFMARELQASTTHRVITRWNPMIAAIDGSWRVKFGARNLVLDGPANNIDEANEWLEMTCTEGLRDE